MVLSSLRKANAALAVLVLCGVVYHLSVNPRADAHSVLLAKHSSVLAAKVTILNDALAKSGVKVGDDWKEDEVVPAGSLNPAAPILQAGIEKTTESNVVATSRPAEAKGEMYGGKLQEAGVNTGEFNSQWNRQFADTHDIEDSYNIGSSPRREKGSFTGMVDDVLKGQDGHTVQKAMQKFNAALSNFVAAEGYSLASVAKSPTKDVHSASRSTATRNSARSTAPVETRGLSHAFTNHNMQSTHDEAHDFFRRNLSPLLHTRPSAAAVRPVAPRTEAAASAAARGQELSSAPAAQSQSVEAASAPSDAADPAAVLASAELFAQIRKVDSEAEEVGGKASKALDQARQVEAQAAVAAQIAARVGTARIMVKRAKQLEKAEESKFRHALSESKETLQLAGSSAAAAESAAAAAAATAEPLHRRRRSAAREWHSAVDGPRPAAARGGKYSAQSLAAAGLRPRRARAAAAKAAPAARRWCDPLGLLCL